MILLSSVYITVPTFGACVVDNGVGVRDAAAKCRELFPTGHVHSEEDVPVRCASIYLLEQACEFSWSTVQSCLHGTPQRQIRQVRGSGNERADLLTPLFLYTDTILAAKNISPLQQQKMSRSHS